MPEPRFEGKWTESFIARESTPEERESLRALGDNLTGDGPTYFTFGDSSGEILTIRITPEQGRRIDEVFEKEYVYRHKYEELKTERDALEREFSIAAKLADRRQAERLEALKEADRNRKIVQGIRAWLKLRTAQHSTAPDGEESVSYHFRIGALQALADAISKLDELDGYRRECEADIKTVRDLCRKWGWSEPPQVQDALDHMTGKVDPPTAPAFTENPLCQDFKCVRCGATAKGHDREGTPFCCELCMHFEHSCGCAIAERLRHA